MEPAESDERTPHPVRRIEFSCVMLRAGVVRMWMSVDFAAVKVHMRMLADLRRRQVRMSRRKFVADPAHRAGQVQYTKQNQRQRNGKFQRQTQPRRNHNPK